MDLWCLDPNREQGRWRIRPPFDTLETLRFLGLLREGRLPRREPVIFAGKRDSRWFVLLLRTSAKMSETIYDMLEVLSFCDRKRA